MAEKKEEHTTFVVGPISESRMRAILDELWTHKKTRAPVSFYREIVAVTENDWLGDDVIREKDVAYANNFMHIYPGTFHGSIVKLVDGSLYGWLEFFGFQFGTTPQAGAAESIGYGTPSSPEFVGLEIRGTNFQFTVKSWDEEVSVPVPWLPEYATTPWRVWVIAWFPDKCQLYRDTGDPPNVVDVKLAEITNLILRFPMWATVSNRDSGLGRTDMRLAAMGTYPVEMIPFSLEAESQIFNSLGIRDVAAHISTEYANCKGYGSKSVIVNNGLDQAVSIQAQGDRERLFSNPLNVGAAFSVAAGAVDYQTLTDYIPYLRLQATCAVAPTAGSLSAWIERLGV